jgi:hypothetical protein
MARFFSLPPRTRGVLALAFLVFPGAAAALVGRILLPWAGRAETPVLVLAALLAAAAVPLLPVVVQLSTGPLLHVSGRVRRLAPLLLAEREGRSLRLHGGTIFDYLVTFRWRDRGATARAETLHSWVSGLLVLAREAEAGALDPETEIVGSAPFLDGLAPRRFGFRTRPATPAERLTLLVDWPNRALKASFAAGRPVLPRLGGARTAGATAADLAARRPRLEQALRRLEARRTPVITRGGSTLLASPRV